MNFDSLINGFFNWLKKPAPAAGNGCTCKQPATAPAPAAAPATSKAQGFPTLETVLSIAQKLWNK